MEYVKLANSDLVVSRLAFGCEPLGGTDWGTVDETAAVAAVRRAYELGINFFDTADVYGLGRSEELLSKALGDRRTQVIVASKCGVNWVTREAGKRATTFRDGSRSAVVAAVNASLRRLRLESVPLYFINWPDPTTPITETMEALLTCQRAGKIRHVGVSNFSTEQIREASGIMPLSAVQLQYNVLFRRAEENVLPYCHQGGLSVVAYGPLAQGLLTGKYQPGARFGQDDRRHRLQHFVGQEFQFSMRALRTLEVVATEVGRSPAQVAIRWVLDSPQIACAIAGAKVPGQVQDNVGAVGWRLTETEWRKIAAWD